MISIWEKESFLEYDVIIIGAGLTGLSTAASLKEKARNLKILVLERGLLPIGASTKNAGFACFGSVSELCRDRQQMGEDGMVELVEQRWKGLLKTKDRLGKTNINLVKKGGFELIDDDSMKYMDEIDSINQSLKGVFNDEVFSVKDRLIPEFGFEGVNHLICNSYEGQLHSGKLVQSLWEYCTSHEIKILTGADVPSVQDFTSGVVKTGEHSFKTKAVVLCTNAFTPDIAELDEDLKPGRGLVMLVKPEKGLKPEGTFHFREGYYYFRDFYGKLIFGGGRELDKETEATTDFGTNETILESLHEHLKNVILPNDKYETEMTWSGIMAFGDVKKPILKQVDKNVFAGVRLGGMGVAISSMVGDELADLVIRTSI